MSMSSVRLNPGRKFPPTFRKQTHLLSIISRRKQHMFLSFRRNETYAWGIAYPRFQHFTRLSGFNFIFSKSGKHIRKHHTSLLQTQKKTIPTTIRSHFLHGTSRFPPSPPSVASQEAPPFARPGACRPGNSGIT